MSLQMYSFAELLTSSCPVFFLSLQVFQLYRYISCPVYLLSCLLSIFTGILLSPVLSSFYLYRYSNSTGILLSPVLYPVLYSFHLYRYFQLYMYTILSPISYLLSPVSCIIR